MLLISCFVVLAALRFLGASKVLFEDTVGEAWSAYTDHNQRKLGWLKGWVFRAPLRTPRRIRRPNWVLLGGLVMLRK